MSGPSQIPESNYKAGQSHFSPAVKKTDQSAKPDSVESVNKRLQNASPDQVLEILINTSVETLRNVFSRFPARKDEIKKCFELKLANAKADVDKVKKALVGLVAVADSQLLIDIVRTAEKNINQSKDKQKQLSGKLVYTAIARFTDYEKHLGKEKFMGGIRETVRQNAGLKDYSPDLAKYDPKRFGSRPVSSEAPSAVAKLPASIMHGRSQPVSEDEFVRLVEKHGLDAVLGSDALLTLMKGTSAYDRHDLKSLYLGYVAAFRSVNETPTGSETTVVVQAEQSKNDNSNAVIAAKTDSDDIKKEIKKHLEIAYGDGQKGDTSKIDQKLPDLSEIKEVKTDPKRMKEFMDILKGMGKSKKI